MIQQGLVQDYSQRLIKGNIYRQKLSRLKLSRLRPHRLRLSRLRPLGVRLSRLQLYGSETGGGGGGADEIIPSSISRKNGIYFDVVLSVEPLDPLSLPRHLDPLRGGRSIGDPWLSLRCFRNSIYLLKNVPLNWSAKVNNSLLCQLNLMIDFSIEKYSVCWYAY